jgi:hypothetical protein
MADTKTGLPKILDTGLNLASTPMVGNMATAPIFGNIYAGLVNAKSVEKKKGEIADFGQKSDLWYDQQYNQDQMGTNVAQAALEKARENLLRTNQQTENTAAVTGATPENVLASKTQNQKQYGDVVTNLAAMGTARQDNIADKHRAEKMKMLGLNLGEHDADIASAQTQMQNSQKQMDAMMDIAGLLAGGI